MILDVLTAVGAIVLVLLVVVLVHEGGHFVLAKMSGVRVDEFAVGFGPRLFAFTRGETTYSFRLIPAGGYVKMAGMLGLEGEADAGERNFYRAPIPKRMATILAGVVANFLLAGILFTVWGATPTDSRVLPGAALDQAGLRNGDVIVSVDGKTIRHDNATDVSADLHAATAQADGHPMTVVYSRGGATLTAVVTPSLIIVNAVTAAASPRPTSGATPAPSPAPTGGASAGAVTIPLYLQFVVTSVNGSVVVPGDPEHVVGSERSATVSGFVINADGSRGATLSNVVVSGVTDGSGAAGAIQAGWRLGVEPSYDGKPLTQALSDGFLQIPSFVKDTATGIYDLLSNPQSGGITGPQGLSGPVGIAQATVTQAHRGGKPLLYWIAFISMNLGLVNLLPIPFLDGGKFVFLVIEAIRGRRLDPKREALIYAVGLALVLLFAIYVTIGDVTRSQ